MDLENETLVMKSLAILLVHAFHPELEPSEEVIAAVDKMVDDLEVAVNRNCAMESVRNMTQRGGEMDLIRSMFGNRDN